MRLAEIFGYDQKKLGSYRDLALGVIAGIASLWAIVGATSSESRFDLWLTLGSALTVIVCCLLTPNWRLILGIAIGIVVIQGWIAVALGHDRRAWYIASSATIAETVLLWLFRNAKLSTDT